MIDLATQINLGVPSVLAMVLGGSFFAALVQIYKARPEKEQLVISSAQGGVEILNGIISALHLELDRKDEQLAECNKRIDTMETELQGLRAKFGQRMTDKPDSGS